MQLKFKTTLSNNYGENIFPNLLQLCSVFFMYGSSFIFLGAFVCFKGRIILSISKPNGAICTQNVTRFVIIVCKVCILLSWIIITLTSYIIHEATSNSKEIKLKGFIFSKNNSRVWWQRRANGLWRKGMTVLFRMKNHSHDDSISSSFANLKEKLEEFENKEDQVWK